MRPSAQLLLREGDMAVYRDFNLWTVFVDGVGFVAGQVTDNISVVEQCDPPWDEVHEPRLVGSDCASLRDSMVSALYCLINNVKPERTRGDLMAFVVRAGVPDIQGPMSWERQEILSQIVDMIYAAAWTGDSETLSRIVQSIRSGV